MTPHWARPPHHPLPRGTRTDGQGHDGSSLNRRPRPSTAPPGLFAPAPEVIAEKAVKAKKRYQATVATGRPSRAKGGSERQAPQPAVCGTDSGYKRHLRNKETACVPCKRAHNERVRVYDKNRVRPQYTRADCGTEAGYQAHRDRKERICDPCRLSHNGKQRERRRTRAAAQGRDVQGRQPVAVCGTSSGYKKHRRNGEESCVPCLAAKREADKVYRESRRAA